MRLIAAPKPPPEKMLVGICSQCAQAFCVRCALANETAKVAAYAIVDTP